MKKTTTNAATARRLPLTSTPENLEEHFSTTLTFGNKTLVTGYYYDPNGKSWYGAVYTFTTADRTCEGEVKLTATSEEQFEDNGHAIAWCMANC